MDDVKRKPIKDVLKKWEANIDGGIGMKEFTDVLQHLGYDGSTDVLLKILAQRAVLEKGGKLDIDEFVNWLFQKDEREQDSSQYSSIVDGPVKILYLTDVEGNWAYFCNFVEVSKGILQFKESGYHFVFGGDTCDKGPGTLRCLRALLQLKKDYPDRVHLLIGNREANKLRFTAECTDEQVAGITPDSPAAYWVAEKARERPWNYFSKLAAKANGVDMADLSEEDVRPHINQANLFQYHLKHDMGSDGDFDFRQQELAHILGRKVEDVSDQEVVNSYMDSVKPGGEICEYMRNAVMVCLLGSTLFVHGQIIGSQFIECGENGVAWALGVVPELGGLSCRHVNDLRAWIVELNQWAQAEFDDWEAQPTWVKPPTEETIEGWSQRGGAGLILYGTPATRVPSVVYCRYLEDNCMPKPYPKQLVDYLVEAGVSRVVIGHTPHGNCPTVIRHEGSDLTIVMADTSYSNMKSDLNYKGDNRGDAVCSIAMDGEECNVHGRTGAGEQIINYVVPYGTGGGDPCIGLSVPADSHFFVKALLAGLQGEMSRYLLCNFDGFKVTYTNESEQNLRTSLFGDLGLPHKRELNHERSSSHHFDWNEGDVAKNVFRSMDQDGDGKVMLRELKDACSDEWVRKTLTLLAPDATLDDIFKILDTNKDGRISMEELKDAIHSPRV